MFEYQTPSVLNQATPAQSSWYALLGTCSTAGAVLTSVANAVVYAIGINIEDANEDIEIQAVVDGVTLPAVTFSATHSTNYMAYVNCNAITRIEEITIDTRANVAPDNQGIILEGKEVCIMARKTSAAGTGNLTGIVRYGVLKDAR